MKMKMKVEVMVMVAFACLPMMTTMMMMEGVSAGVVLLTSSNTSFHFPFAEASFAPRVPDSGIVGVLFTADPLFGCKPLLNRSVPRSNLSAFLLVERGRCSFATKVLHAQDAGFSAVIVYDNEDGEEMVTMSGDESGVNIPAVFIYKRAGKILLQHMNDKKARCHVISGFDNTAWLIITLCIVLFMAVLVGLSTVLCGQRRRLRSLSSRFLSCEAMGMTEAEVKALPIHVHQASNSEACAICLEQYSPGDKLRILPCNHGFHWWCIDKWLMMLRPLCPICKHDARDMMIPHSEHTPLLKSSSVVPSSPPSTECGSLTQSLNRAPDSHVSSTFTPLSSHLPSDLTLLASLISTHLQSHSRFNIPIHIPQA